MGLPASGYLYGTYENPTNAGDGYSMAYHAGAELTNIECFQINPLIKDYNGPACAYVAGPFGAYTANAEGYRFINCDYWSGQMMLEVWKELNSGKGPIQLKMTHLKTFDLLTDPDVVVRQEVVLTLGHLTDDEVISHLSWALTSDADWQVRRNAAKSLAIHASSKVLPALSMALKDEHWQVRKFVLQALKIPSDRLLPDLIQTLTDEFSDVRKEAAIAIGKLSNSEALNALQQALDDPDREVSIQAERAIKKIQETFEITT